MNEPKTLIANDGVDIRVSIRVLLESENFDITEYDCIEKNRQIFMT